MPSFPPLLSMSELPEGLLASVLTGYLPGSTRLPEALSAHSFPGLNLLVIKWQKSFHWLWQPYP
ncbi:MAG TPA: hypothetical protein VH186_36655 [Chloroflexia bacterium]|nr:hypothetical protein [Chloroflexia bacterium]